MSLRYLLDTNIVSDLIEHGEQSIILDVVRHVGDIRVCTSAIVAAEFQFGVGRKGSDKLRMAAARVLGALPVLPIDFPAAMRYGVIRAHLEGEGRGIGSNDLQIAAQCVSHGLVVTDNTKEFERVPDLVVANWLNSAYRYPGPVDESRGV